MVDMYVWFSASVAGANGVPVPPIISTVAASSWIAVVIVCVTARAGTAISATNITTKKRSPSCPSLPSAHPVPRTL
jgi:hypothetical protein